MKWEELPLADRARLMAAAVRNGYTDIRSIKEAYANYLNLRKSAGNRYAEGGDTNNEDEYHDSFYEWKKAISKYMGLKVDDDNTYNYMSFYYDNPTRAWAMLEGDPNAHFTDEYKTANHPTFSDESNLSGKYDPIYNPLVASGGTWTENPNTFTLPKDWYKGPSIPERIHYLERAEDDGVTMFMPDGSLPTLYNNEPWGGVLPNVEIIKQKEYGGNLFLNGGNKSRQSKKDYYRQLLIIRGLRGAQLEAVLANMEVESGFNPNAHNKSSGAHGLMQWLGTRKPKSWSEKDLLDYIAATYNKFGGNEWLDKKAWERFNKTTDPVEAARLFRRYWERPEKSSWYATDKYFGKSYLPLKTNDLISQLQDLTWSDVQKRRKRFELTPEEERLYNSKPTLFYNADYADWNDLTNSKTFEQAYAPYALNSELDNTPSNGWALYNSLLNTQSLTDPLSWMTMMASLSPKTTSQQKDAASLYQLFAPQGDDYMYHGLNFAAYGGRLFSDGGFENTPEEQARWRALRLNTPYTNYEEAIDMEDSAMLRAKKFLDKGVSNCTLTASQIVRPGVPIARARTITTHPELNGFQLVDEDHVVPGTMVIASLPDMSDQDPNQKYHTMIVTGFAPWDYDYTFRDGTVYHVKKGEPLVSYSRGGASDDNYVKGVPLRVYNDKGDGKTYNRYYRPIGLVMLDNIDVIGNKNADGGHLFPFGGYTNAINAINLTGEGFYYVIDGQKMDRQQALDYINKHKNETYVVNRYSTTASTAGKQKLELNWQTLDHNGNWIDNNEYHPAEGNLDEVIVTHPYTINNSLSQDRTYLQHTPIRDLTVTAPIDFTNTEQNMFHRRDVADADAYVREALSSDVVDNIYDYLAPSAWAGLADKALEGGYSFNQLFNPTYDNQGWVGLFDADQWAKEHPEEAFAINFGTDLVLPFGIKGTKTAIGAATRKLPEASRNLVASSTINYGAKTRSLPTNIYKQRMLFNVGENGRHRYIHEYNPLADFIDTKRRVPSNTSYFFRSPNNVDILNVHNGSYGAKAQGNVIIGSGSVDGKFVSYGEPWMEFGVNPKLDAWYEFPTMRHRGPHRMATDWRGNRMDYTTQEAYDQMAIRRNPEFHKEYNDFIFKDFNSREEALQAQKDFNEKWGIDPSVNVYDIYHSNQTVIPNKEWNFNSEYPRGFLSQPFWRYTQDPYSGAVQKELMMNWKSPMKVLDETHADIIPFLDELGEWDYLTDFRNEP